MGNLQFKRVTREVETVSFDCGIPSINNYVKDSYFPVIAQHAYAYSVMSNMKILGYYQVLFREIAMTHFPAEISDYDSGIKDGRISSVHIRYIAVDKMYHRHGIGTGVLKTIIKDVSELSGGWPIRVITVDARKELVDWYKKIGFNKIPINTDGQDGVTEAMFFDCLKYVDELKKYLKENLE